MKTIRELVAEADRKSAISFEVFDDAEYILTGDAPLTDLAKLDGVHVIPTVWSNGRAVRRYCGQDGGKSGDSSNTSVHRTKGDGYRKMVAILVEIEEDGG